jgi:cytochrome P450
MTLTHEPAASAPADELPAFPMARECPFSPPSAYKQMREERPVAPVRLWNGNKAWLVTRFEDVRRILADNRRVSNNITHPGFPVLYAARAAVMQQHGKPPYFHFMDPPEHTENRGMFTQDFSVIRVKEMEEEIQSIVDEVIDETLAGADRSADFVKAVALPIPTRVIARVLGIPYGLDDNVRPAAQTQFVETYRAMGGSCDYTIFEDCQHEWVASPGPQTDRAYEMAKEFIARHVNA